MATAVIRRTAIGIVAGCVLVPSALLLSGPAYAEDPVVPADASVGEAVYVEATPDPVTGLYPGQAAPATESSPGTGGWITGGTLQEAQGQAKPPAQPVAKPAAKPGAVQVAEPVTAPAAPVVRRRSTRTTRTTAVQPRTTTATSSGSSAGAAPGGPTALPFTGPDRLEAELAVGGALVVMGMVLTSTTRPRTLLLRSRW